MVDFKAHAGDIFRFAVCNDVMLRIREADGTSAMLARTSLFERLKAFEGHPGEITRTHLFAHHCLKKHRVFLERYGSNPYWSDRAIAEARKLKSKGAKKELRRKKKQAAAKEQQMLDALACDIQKTADGLPCALTVVRVKREWPSVFKLYYVSDNRFWDATVFPELTAALQAAYPGRRFLLRHIRDVDGYYVSHAEYPARKR